MEGSPSCVILVGSVWDRVRSVGGVFCYCQRGIPYVSNIACPVVFDKKLPCFCPFDNKDTIWYYAML